MSYRRRAGGGKRDSAEAAIVQALRAVGAIALQVGGTGNPDLLIRYAGRWTPCEVKTGTGRLTRNQQAILWPVIRTVDEALQLIGVSRLVARQDAER